jgi:hypothetical protein
MLQQRAQYVPAGKLVARRDERVMLLRLQPMLQLKTYTSPLAPSSTSPSK